MSSSKSGCGASAIFVLLFIASVAVNGVLLSGCVTQGKCPLCRREKNGQTSSKSMAVYDAADDLREIANKLGIDTDGKDARELASSIKTQLYVRANAKGFPRELLSSEQFEEVKDVLPRGRAEIIDAYQKFIKSLEGKRFVVIP